MAQDSKSGSKKSLPLVVAIVMAVLGIMFMQRHVKQEKTKLATELRKDKIWVVYLSRGLPVGSSLTAEVLKNRPVVKEDQPWSTIKFKNPDAGVEENLRYEDIITSLLGRTLTRQVKKGDLLLWTDLDEPQLETLGDILKGNQRAVAVAVDSASVMSGLLQPNDRVDVLAKYGAGIEIDGNVRGGVNKTVVVLEDVTVVAVGGSISRSERSAQTSYRGTTVILALSSDKALILSHVQKEAKISLLLRPRQASEAGGYSRSEVLSDDIPGMLEKLKEEE